jgi:hypothetical protein
MDATGPASYPFTKLSRVSTGEDRLGNRPAQTCGRLHPLPIAVRPIYQPRVLVRVHRFGRRPLRLAMRGGVICAPPCAFYVENH